MEIVTQNAQSTKFFVTVYAIWFGIRIAVKRIVFTIGPILYMTVLHTSLSLSSSMLALPDFKLPH